MFLKFLITFFATAVLSFSQTGYDIIIERAVLRNCNTDYININVTSFKLNRTYTAVNISSQLKCDLNYDLMANVQTYKFQSNEYRKFPMDFERNVCESFGRNEFGLRNCVKCGNFKRCPFKKGYYYICNWGPDAEKFPPFVPSGRYRIDVTATFKRNMIFEIEWYFEIKTIEKLTAFK